MRVAVMKMPSIQVKTYWNLLFPVFSRFVAVYFIWAFHQLAGFPPDKDLSTASMSYLVLFIFFMVLPLAQRIRIGKFLEFEAKVKRVEEEVRDVRTETRQLVSTISAVANTISSSVRQTVVLNFSAEERERARAGMADIDVEGVEPQAQKREIQRLLDADGSDVNYALARLRMDLEQELRRVLGKRLSVDDPISFEGKYLTARSLFHRLVSEVPKYERMEAPFHYTLKVCNAAIHGQSVPENIAYEAMDLGLRMLDELKKEDVL